jgi:hypothetical protein
MKIGEFFVQLGINADTLKLKDFVNSLGELPLAAAGAIAGLAGISLSLGDMIENTLGTAVGLKKFNDQTGLSVDELQKWQAAAERMNVSSGTMQASLEGLYKNITQIKLGMGGNAQGFMMLGIDPRQSPFKILEQLRAASHKYNREQFSEMIEMMGLSREMVSVLRLSTAEFNKQSNVPNMNLEQMEKFLKLKNELVEMGQEAKQFGFDVMEFLVKPMELLIKSEQMLYDVWQKMFKAGSLAKEDIEVFMKGGSSITGDLVNFIMKRMSPIGEKPAMGSVTNNFDVDINNHGSDPNLTSQRNVEDLTKMKNKHAGVRYTGTAY